MDCPACSRQLQQKQVGEITVDVCENGCGGIWLDNFELEKIDEKHEAVGEALLDVAKDDTIAVDYEQIRDCPKCDGIKMMKHFVSVAKKVEIDECGACGGIWLDAGELGSIRNELPDEEGRSEAAQAYFNEVFGDKIKKISEEEKEKTEKSNKIARVLRFICPSYYIPGKQDGGAF